MSSLRRKKCTECKNAFTYESVATHEWFPFCSERCKTVDLGRWFNNEYAVVEDLNRGHDMADNIDLDAIEDPDVRAALEELKDD